MPEPASSDISKVGEALESLVHQFADPWAFLRELVQNSIDAGTAQIDVRIDHDPARGTMIIEVADFGEGMTREVIDTRLTRLFASSKEGDYTKIGRFGIGFVSVFALDPDIVCVDTGRAGEWWRVVFRRDRSFERIKLGSPVEGTMVRLYKQADEAGVALARAKARQTLEHWCKHAAIELSLDGELISRAFDLEGLCKVHHDEDGTKLVMAIVREPAALRGYYHGGLTLHEEHDDSLPHVAFKIDSRFLEHTLTRDNVIRDENYAKAMAIVGKVARTRLIGAAFEALERGLVQGGLAADELALLHHSVTACFTRGRPDPSWLAAAIVPMLGEPPASLESLRAVAADRLWQAPALTPVVERLRRDGHRVVACEPGSAVEALIVAARGKRPSEAASLCLPVPLAAHEQPTAWQPLLDALRSLIGRRFKVGELVAAHLGHPGSSVADRLMISQARFGELEEVAAVGRLASGWLASSRVLVLDVDHPTARHAQAIARSEPELAAYLVLKAFLLHEGELAAGLDDELASSAAEARWRRMA